MESFFVRFKNPLMLVVLLVAQTIGLAVQVRRPVAPVPIASGPVAPDVGPAPSDSHSVSLVRYWVVSVVMPFERFFHGIGYNLRHGWSNYIDLRHTRQQNEALQQQLANMRLEQASIAQDAIQGHRLQALLDFQQQYITHTIAAQVIGTSGTDFSRVVYIDKGREDGLKPDQAVITPDGIVGKIRDVFPHTAQVLLINDQTSGAGVLLASSRIRAILRGSSTGRIVINNLTPDSRIKSGDVILTSGGDQIYPRGLPVGTIQSIELDPEHQPYTLIQIVPAAKLTQLEEVLIITGTQAQLPLQAQQDLVLGAATAQARAAAAAALAARVAELKAAEDAKSAADIVADRLPNLHDATEQDPNAPKPAADSATGGKMPRPLPALHPDRFSPGSSPSAASMKPGSTNSGPPSSGSMESSPTPTRRAPPIDPETGAPATATPTAPVRKPQPKPVKPVEPTAATPDPTNP